MILPAPGPSVVSAFDFVLFGILGWSLEQSRKADMTFGREIVFSCRAASNFTSSSRCALAGILP